MIKYLNSLDSIVSVVRVRYEADNFQDLPKFRIKMFFVFIASLLVLCKEL